jgi:aminoglycoside phosphotransferase family enzyme
MDIALLRNALLDATIYPDHPEEVRSVQTHISLLFLTGGYVYKIKKPVDFGFLDFSSLEKRKYFCEQEVELNRRLAPDIYLGVAAITLDGDRVCLNGVGEIIEYAVKMKQVPESQLMDRLLKENRVTEKMIEAVSEMLFQFYLTAETGDYIRRFAKPERIKQDTDENFEQTRRFVNVTIPGEAYSEIQERTNRFFKTHEALFYERIASDRIRDCHGDLRLEHILWGEEIAILDCIEFNERFRYTDVAADISFLAMDLDYHGREDLGRHLIGTYISKSGDYGLSKVLDFYKCYRAYVRGKVESFRSDDPNGSETEKKGAVKRARKYFELSYRYALRF